MKYYQLTNEGALSELSSSIDGLSESEVSQRLITYGYNEIPSKKKVRPWQIFLNQFKDFMILILMFAAVISGYLGDMADTIIIMIIVLLNAVIGFYQEYKAEQAIDALKKMAALSASVLREGKTTSIDAKGLVPGDIVLMESGNKVPADIRLLETFSFKADESTLTGESVSIEKNAKPIDKEDLITGDIFNMVFKGTNITNGRATGIVVRTGLQTELGKIASLLQTGEPKTPLQIRMADFSKKLSYIILAICLLLFSVGWMRGENPMDMLLLSISLAVAAIPEALPALITIALARGSARMVKKFALVRKLPAVETLGSVNFICSDKTGTLTQNKMTVTQTLAISENHVENESLLHLCMALNNDVQIDSTNHYIGDPTEIALVDYLNKLHHDKYCSQLKNQYPRVGEVPFDSDRKCMTTVHQWHNGYVVITKGAAESIVNLLEEGGDISWLPKVSEWSSLGLRVLTFAYKFVQEIDDTSDLTLLEKDLVFAGMTAMIDPPREEVKIAIQECKTAGITPVMITGDHQQTAVAIAKEIGIWNNQSLSCTGEELKNFDPEYLHANVEKISVYARVSPEQKLSIISALQSKNHFVSMTGDGVNDAPALKSANIGVAMGITGTDVTKESSDMILLDDNFATIVNAVKEGRRIFDNIRKFVKYIMTCNSAEIWTIVLAPLIGLPIPLLPIHILWINLVTDGLPGIALSGEKAEPDIMLRPPRKTAESLFSDGIGIHIIWVGLLMAGVTIGTQAWAIGTGLAHWQTMVFTVLAFSQLGHVMAIRSERSFLYKQGIFSNLPLLGAVLFTFVMQLVVIYAPFANKLLKTQPLTVKELALCIGLSLIIFHAVELEKFLKHKKKAN